jgi:hypothetical protein
MENTPYSLWAFEISLYFLGVEHAAGGLDGGKGPFSACMNRVHAVPELALILTRVGQKSSKGMGVIVDEAIVSGGLDRGMHNSIGGTGRLKSTVNLGRTIIGEWILKDWHWWFRVATKVSPGPIGKNEASNDINPSRRLAANQVDADLEAQSHLSPPPCS